MSHFYEDSLRYDMSSALTTHMSIMKSVPFCRRYRIRRSHFCLESVIFTGGFMGWGDPDGWALSLNRAQTVCMKGLLNM